MKKWFNSKIIWFNILTLVATSTGWAVGFLTTYPKTVVALMLASAVSNILLRFITKSKIEPLKLK